VAARPLWRTSAQICGGLIRVNQRVIGVYNSPLIDGESVDERA